jgi:hypothetical protein
MFGVSEKIVSEALDSFIRSSGEADNILSDEERAEIAASGAILDDMSNKGWKGPTSNVEIVAGHVINLANQIKGI